MKLYQRLNNLRKIVQTLTIVFLVVVPILNYFNIYWIIGTLYSISIGGLDITDPAMALQSLLLTKEIYVPLLLTIILPVTLALILGRVFCSWMCPYNTISDWINTLLKKTFSKRWKKVHYRSIEKNPSPWINWEIFAGLVILMLVIDFSLFGFLSPPGIISSVTVQVVLGIGMGLEIGIVLLILLIETILLKRFWCNYVCPVGAVLSLFRVNRTLQVVHSKVECSCNSGAEPCRYTCPFDLSPKKLHLYPSCHNCGICIATCEKVGSGALSFRFGKHKTAIGKINLIENQKVNISLDNILK